MLAPWISKFESLPSILRQYRFPAVKIYANFAPDKMIDMDGRIDGRAAAKRKGGRKGSYRGGQNLKAYSNFLLGVCGFAFAERGLRGERLGLAVSAVSFPLLPLNPGSWDFPFQKKVTKKATFVLPRQLWGIALLIPSTQTILSAGHFCRCTRCEWAKRST